MARALFGVGSDAIIFNKDNQVLLLRRSDDDPWMPGSWGLPGGKLEKDEDPDDAIKREVKEETNLDVDIIQPFSVYKFFKETSGVDVVTIKYLAHYKSGEVKLSSEHKHFAWFAVEQLPDDLDGKIAEWIKNGYELVKQL